MNDEDFESLMRGMEQTRAFLRGEHVPGMRAHLGIDIPGTRKRAGLTQQAFARQIGVPLGTLRNWEQGRREPDGSARVLIAMLDRDPMIVARTLAQTA